MKLDAFNDLEEYTTAFENLVHTMREYKIGLTDNDEDVLYQYEKGLPDAYKYHKTIRLAQNLNLATALTFYKQVAKDDSLPGAIGASKAQGMD